MAAPLAVMGLPGSFGRFFEFYRQRGQSRGFLRYVLLATVGLSFGFIGVVLAFPSYVSLALLGTVEHSQLIRVLAVSLSLVIAMNVLSELAIAMRQVRLMSVIQFVHSVTFAISACALLAFTSLSDQGVVIGYSIGALAALVIGLTFLIKRIRELPADEGSIDRTLWSRLIPFAAWIWVANILFNLFDTIDRIMIVHFAPVAQSADAIVGQYHSSRVIPVLLVALATMVGSVILPYLTEDWEKGYRDKARSTTILAFKSCSLLFVFGGFCVLLMAPILFGTMLQGRYDAGMQVLPMTLVYCIWFALIAIIENYLFCTERAKMVSVALLVALVANVALNALLLPWLGLFGAVTATLSANGIALCGTMIFCQRNGLQIDRQTWLLVALPTLLLFDWKVAAIGLFALGFAIVRMGILFDESERRQIQDVGVKIAHRFGF